MLGRTTKTFNFQTGSTYEGSWDESRECMHGFGCYRYPDGSIYHGYFTNGKFHGFGALRLAAPYTFTIKGLFEDGKLKKIETMYFEDGLRCVVEPKDKTLDFSEWRYCSKDDRRFPMEILNGLRAVGPNTMITTPDPFERDLPIGTFDAQMGVYHPNSGFMTNRPPPYTPSQFLGCTDETAWIQRYCREGRDPDEKVEPEKIVCDKTMNTNIDAQRLVNMKYDGKCSLEQKPGHKYFSKLYDIEIEEAKKSMKGLKISGKDKDIFPHVKRVQSGGSIVAEKTESRSSFSVKLKDKTLDNLVCEQKSGFLNRSDKSLSVNMSLMNARQKRFN